MLDGQGDGAGGVAGGVFHLHRVDAVLRGGPGAAGGGHQVAGLAHAVQKVVLRVQRLLVAADVDVLDRLHADDRRHQQLDGIGEAVEREAVPGGHQGALQAVRRGLRGHAGQAGDQGVFVVAVRTGLGAGFGQGDGLHRAGGGGDDADGHGVCLWVSAAGPRGVGAGGAAGGGQRRAGGVGHACTHHAPSTSGAGKYPAATGSATSTNSSVTCQNPKGVPISTPGISDVPTI